MCVEMLLLIANLIKLFGTTMDWAREWLFGRVYSEMVKEVVPFPKEFSAESMVAREDTRNPPS